MKKTHLLLLLIPALLASCSANSTNEPSTTSGNSEATTSSNKDIRRPTFKYVAPEEVAINITKVGVEVTSVEVINIPDSGIKIADWDNSNIKLHVSYNDSTTEDFDFLVKHIPLESRHYLGEIGHHSIEILVNGHSTTFGFNIINNPDFLGYTCTFIDSYSHGEVYETTVGYYQNVTYAGPDFPEHVVGTEFIRKFIGWDYPLDNVHQDMTYNSVYRDTEKRFYGDAVAEGQNNVVSTYKDTDNDTIHALLYLGRIHRVAMNYGATVYHQNGDEAVELSFQELTLFNERWVELNKDSVSYGIRYLFDNTTGQYLFGSSTALTTSPIYLSNFENIYDQTSCSIRLDTGAVITTSDSPNYSTVYSIASEHKDETVSVASDKETGYYRIAVVASFDAYVSVSFSKLAYGKYRLETNSKFVFAPVVASVDVCAQFSETEDFINNFDKKIELSNTMLYNVAQGLDWED